MSDTKPVEDKTTEAGASEEPGVLASTATTAATAATTAATTVSNKLNLEGNVLSMFGGGGAKPKREEVDEEDEPSGSSRAQKAKAEGEDVRLKLPMEYSNIKNCGVSSILTCSCLG